MISQNIESILNRSFAIANEYHHKYATYEHLLLALVEESEIQKLFRHYRIDTLNVVKKLQQYLECDLSELIDSTIQEIKPTIGLQRIVQRTIVHSQANSQSLSVGYLLAEFFFEQGAYAVNCLRESHLTRQHVLRYLAKHTKHQAVATEHDTTTDCKQKLPNHDLIEISEVKTTKKTITKSSSNSKEKTTIIVNESSYLEIYCINLNAKASNGNVDCLVGRQHEIQRTIEILCRRRKNNALLVGEPGVGKTAIAEGLALRIENQEVPDLLKKSVIYSLDIGSVVAGTKYRGDFEDRIKKIFIEIKNRPEVILFIDEIHTLIGAGSSATGSLDASNLLKPAFAKGEIRCIGSTTFREYHNHFEKDMALVRRFQKVIINEPDEQASIQILQGLKSYYEQYHKVKYHESAIVATVLLSARYIHDRHLPDKAIDLMDEAGARKSMVTGSDQPAMIMPKDIEELVSTIVNIPNISVSDSDIANLRDLEHNLKNHIFGQDDAISKLCASIKLSRAGLKKINRPIGCYLFAGITGVGKTELAKQLAKFCNMELIQFDMSEFSESHTISKLLGCPPGYSGFDQGGQLTDEIDKHQYSVVLFDEIEKAHPEIMNLLLQIMDEGSINDNTGKVINFSHTIIILTTNIGSAETKKTPMGFSNNDSDTKHKSVLEAIHRVFSPELRNRLDNIIIFNSLEDRVINRIIEKNLKELSNQLIERNVKFSIDRSIITYLAKNCFAQENGARILDRIIDNAIKQPIADEILFGKLQNGGSLSITVNNNNQLKFKFTSTKKSEFSNSLEFNAAMVVSS